ncbi:MAG: hypothetical protein KDB16_00645 [Acidimicrobiales bacterium]|nr:hypothetical protein [Acidimicrobiales bacterium]
MRHVSNSLRFLSRQAPLASRLEALLRMWSQPQRAYHDTEHLDRMLGATTWLADELDVRDPAVKVSLELAVWYHDAVYDAQSTDNEARSADLARQSLGGLVPEATVEQVARLVLLTAGHSVAEGDLEGCLVVDADLSILGAEPAVYDSYRGGVRAEYGHLDDATFIAGRSAFLRGMLERSRVFNTAPARLAWQAQAHENMAHELEALARS